MPEREKQPSISIRLSREELRARDAAERDGQFLAPAVERVLGPLFAGVERDMGQLSGEDIVRSLNRGNLIAIDGRTVRSMMEERYTGAKEDFSDWYKENLSAMTGQLVSAALRQGRRVEALIPDSRGGVSGEPVQIIGEGVDPQPLTPVRLNRVQRLLTRFGLFREKAARSGAYQRAMEGREQLRVNYKEGRALAARATQARVAAVRARGAHAEAKSLQRAAVHTAAPGITPVRHTFKPTRGQQLIHNAAVAQKARLSDRAEPPKPKLTNAQRLATVRAAKMKKAQAYIRRKEQPVRERREAEAAAKSRPAARRTPNGPIRRPPNGPSRDLGGRTM